MFYIFGSYFFLLGSLVFTCISIKKKPFDKFDFLGYILFVIGCIFFVLDSHELYIKN